MPTSPLPSSINNSGLKWPSSITDENGLSASARKDKYEIQCNSDRGNTKNVLYRTENEVSQFKKSNGNLRVNIENEQIKKEETEHFPLLEAERLSVNSDDSTNSDYKVYHIGKDSSKTESESSNFAGDISIGRCVNCEERQQIISVSGQYSNNIPTHIRHNISVEENLRKSKRNNRKNKRCLWKKYLKLFIAAISLIIISSLGTYVVISEVHKINHRGESQNLKNNHTEFLVKMGQYLVDKEGHFHTSTDPHSKKHSEKLSGIYFVLDASSLKGENEMLKWKNSTKKRFSQMNHGIEYLDGRFKIAKSAWYIVYSKLNLATYQNFDSDGNITRKLHTYQHCVVMETAKERELIDSLCNRGAQWGGWIGPSQIWSPMYMKKGTTVKVTMRNKNIVSNDSESNVFTIIELEQN